MGLDTRGIISVIELIAYIPLLIISACLIFKHGFGKKEGWVYLVLLSVIRITGGVTHVMSEHESSPSSNLLIVVGVTEASGVSPLLLATLGFLGTVSQLGFEDVVILPRALLGMKLLSHVALALTIAGGVKVGTNETPDGVDDINSGIKLRRIGVVLFVIQLAATMAITVVFWGKGTRILKHRRTLLKAITASIPFLAVRVLYAILSAWSPTGLPFPGVNNGPSAFKPFNSTMGNAGIYLVMSVIMEFIVVIIYVTAGLMIPLQNDYAGTTAVENREDNIGLYPSVYAPNSRHVKTASSLSVEQPRYGEPRHYPVAESRGY